MMRVPWSTYCSTACWNQRCCKANASLKLRHSDHSRIVVTLASTRRCTKSVTSSRIAAKNLPYVSPERLACCDQASVSCSWRPAASRAVAFSDFRIVTSPKEKSQTLAGQPHPSGHGHSQALPCRLLAHLPGFARRCVLLSASATASSVRGRWREAWNMLIASCCGTRTCYPNHYGSRESNL